MYSPSMAVGAFSAYRGAVRGCGCVCVGENGALKSSCNNFLQPRKILYSMYGSYITTLKRALTAECILETIFFNTHWSNHAVFADK